MSLSEERRRHVLSKLAEPLDKPMVQYMSKKVDSETITPGQYARFQKMPYAERLKFIDAGRQRGVSLHAPLPSGEKPWHSGLFSPGDTYTPGQALSAGAPGMSAAPQRPNVTVLRPNLSSSGGATSALSAPAGPPAVSTTGGGRPVAARSAAPQVQQSFAGNNAMSLLNPQPQSVPTPVPQPTSKPAVAGASPAGGALTIQKGWGYDKAFAAAKGQGYSGSQADFSKQLGNRMLMAGGTLNINGGNISAGKGAVGGMLNAQHNPMQRAVAAPTPAPATPPMPNAAQSFARGVGGPPPVARPIVGATTAPATAATPAPAAGSVGYYQAKQMPPAQASAWAGVARGGAPNPMGGAPSVAPQRSMAAAPAPVAAPAAKGGAQPPSVATAPAPKPAVPTPNNPGGLPSMTDIRRARVLAGQP